MTRSTRPIDEFMQDLTVWLDGAWLMWTGMAAALLIVVVVVVIAKLRARARDRVPHYRRNSS